MVFLFTLFVFFTEDTQAALQILGTDPLTPAPVGGSRRPFSHQPTSHEGVGPNRATRKSISARTRDESVRLGK